MKDMKLTTRTEEQIFDFLQSLTDRQREVLLDNCKRFAKAYKEGRLIILEPFKVKEVCFNQTGVFTLNFQSMQEILDFDFTYYADSGLIADILTVKGHESFESFSFCNLPKFI